MRYTCWCRRRRTCISSFSTYKVTVIVARIAATLAPAQLPAFGSQPGRWHWQDYEGKEAGWHARAIVSVALFDMPQPPSQWAVASPGLHCIEFSCLKPKIETSVIPLDCILFHQRVELVQVIDVEEDTWRRNCWRNWILRGSVSLLVLNCIEATCSVNYLQGGRN